MIRLATLDDLDALTLLEEECFTTDKMSYRNFRDALKKPTIEMLVAEINNTVIGCAVTHFRKNSFTARLYSLSVKKEFRSAGIAGNLCKALEKNAQKRQCEHIILEVRPDNLSAIHFYKKYGYDTFGLYNQFYEDGSHALRMKKTLKNDDSRYSITK